jgi:putative hydrolase of the HAD superfamily
MVGNSVKSDVLPVIAIGANAIHVPFHTTWAHEEVKKEEGHTFLVVKNIAEVSRLLKE